MRPVPLLFAVVLAALPASAETYRGYDQAPYTVTRQTGAVELRQYAPRTVAEVIVRGSRTAAVQRGFSELASYIFGKNATKEKIAMTVPVGQRETPRGWIIRFTMPPGTTAASLPRPENSAIVVKRLPAERLLVIRFDGRATQARLDEMDAALRAQADRQGITLTGAPQLMFYDDPFTMPWNRRNEIAYSVAP
ncbi:MAG: heme-binding protein [Rhodobacteraceae bacterium]|nr:heme-binding protein [Paracoccaceae bacterium]